MKKLIRSLFALGLCLLFCTSALADGSTYELSDIGIRVTVPPEYTVVTHDTPSDSPGDQFLASMGMTKEDVLQSDYYLVGLSLDSEFNIAYVSDETNSIGDMRYMSDAELNEKLQTFVSQYSFRGVQLESSRVYLTGHTRFFVLRHSGTIQYITVFDGIGICLNFTSYTGTITPEQEDMLEAMVNSIEFIAEPEAPVSSVTVWNIIGICIIAVSGCITAFMIFDKKKKENEAGTVPDRKECAP